ncbi:MAG: hypothetical protein HYX54_08495 [Chloroflexi bacterium]|nr:hypothetical protein [Chloroflexota bacterium]
MTEAVQQAWRGALDLISGIVIPDWGALIGLLPILLLVGVVAPLLSLLLLGWFIYIVRAPRAHLKIVEGPVAAAVVGGEVTYPSGEPYCPVDQLVYPSGSTRCDICHRELLVRCPKCEAGRHARVDTCGNCGLVLKIENRGRALRPAGPPPGGAAAA